VANGGGGLVSTLSDYARFAQMLLNGGELDGRRVCGAAALKTMMSDHLTPEFIARGWGVGAQQLRPGFSYAWNGAVFTDPDLAGVPVGKGAYHWDGAAGTWFWVDPTNDLLYVGLIQLLSESAPPLQKTTQTMMADAILDAPATAAAV
jgi:CubicO group peptidase (beta-lactamase class C family)